jgi:hypothetical protein
MCIHRLVPGPNVGLHHPVHRPRAGRGHAIRRGEDADLGYVLMVAFFFGALSVFDGEIDR